MSIRSCIYINCENYVNFKDRTINEDITLFSFPKNPERRQKWIEYGKAPTNLPDSMYYYCSDHFDKCFLAVNNRRTILVGEAVPHIFVDEALDETYDDENVDFVYELKDDASEVYVEEQPTQEEEILVESTTSYTLNEDHNNDDDGNLELDVEYTKVPKKNDSNTIMKRKLNDSVAPKQKMLKTNQPSKENLAEKSPSKKLNIISVKSDPQIRKTNAVPVVKLTPKEPEISTDTIVDTKHVTTFIYLGEEYVQMPKQHYIKEKMELLKKLQKMERVVETIKEQLNILEFE